MPTIPPTLRCDCHATDRELAFRYTERPARETVFPLNGPYDREYRRCSQCGHFFTSHQMDLSGLYDSAYLDATYGDTQRLRAAYNRILALTEGQSDNRGRVRRINEFFLTYRAEGGSRKLLDIGAGLGVFCQAMSAVGWTCVAFEADRRFADHIDAVVGIETLVGDFVGYSVEVLGLFDLVALNKVLEHVEDPIAMLTKAGGLLVQRGVVYLEVPDGDAAMAFGLEREEFFIEHLHVFSPASVAAMIARAGLSLLRLDRLHEPSDKYTLAAFAAPAAGTP